MLNNYTDFTRSTAKYAVEQTDPQVVALLYCGNGLAGEAGEVSNVIKKLHRDGNTPELQEKIVKELGDVLWYVARIADELDIGLHFLFEANRLKLEGRLERGTISGSGDDR